MSALESVANVAIGFGIALAATLTILPFFGYNVTTQDGIGITLAFTAVSLVRSYALRRMFETSRLNR